MMKRLFQISDNDKTNSINPSDYLIVDVRSHEEFESGHIPDSVNIPLHEIGDHIREFKSVKQPLLMVCRSGMRSGQAVKILGSFGIDAKNGGSWKSITQVNV